MKKKVIIIERIFSFYRKPVFDELSRHTELTVLCGKNNSGIKTIETPYSESIPSIQYGKKDTFVLLFPLAKILSIKPQVVICDFAMGMLNLPIIILVCKLFKIKVAFWSHGYNRKTGFQPETVWADKYRLFLLKMVDANILYGQFDQQLLKKYLNEESIFVAQNTLDTGAFSKINQALEAEGRESIKKRLGIKHACNLVFIGRLISSKSPGLLLDIYALLQRKYGVTPGVHFIGGGPLLPLLQARVEQDFSSDDFYFHGPVHDPYQTGELLFVNDLMVLPGDLGLSINHAFCFGCPVLSFKRKNGYPAHGPEIEYLEHNKTGFLVEEQTAEAIAATINEYLQNSNLRNAFQKNIRIKVEQVFPLEKMVNGVLDCIAYLANKKEEKDLKSNLSKAK